MFKKLRRSRKAQIESIQRNDSIATSASTRVTYFDLPGELRNDIYTLVATSCTLHIFHPSSAKVSKKSSASPSSSIPGLLLASKQCRNEYLPLLLSIAPLTATVTDFDFRPLARVIGSLYATELKALRTNENVTISLRLRRCGAEVVPNLRRWCVARADSLDRLGWRYVLGEEVPEARLLWFLERVVVLLSRVEGEGEKWEVGQVLEALRVGVAGEGETCDKRGGGYGDEFVFVMASRMFPRASS